jgi:hypothetical protein
MSKNDEDHVQCVLEKNGGLITTWIPVSGAQLRKVIKIKDAKGDWDEGWTVKAVTTVRLPGSVVSERGQDYKNTRKASDV